MKDYKALNEELQNKLEELQQHMDEVTKFADENGLTFYLQNMTYYPNCAPNDLAPNGHYYYDPVDEEENPMYTEWYAGRWMSSTDECTVGGW